MDVEVEDVIPFSHILSNFNIVTIISIPRGSVIFEKKIVNWRFRDNTTNSRISFVNVVRSKLNTF